eukprot:scaffold19891_cov28-Tisochrysis_lutea.AAC.4
MSTRLCHAPHLLRCPQDPSKGMTTSPRCIVELICRQQLSPRPDYRWMDRNRGWNKPTSQTSRSAIVGDRVMRPVLCSVLNGVATHTAHLRLRWVVSKLVDV